jgi:hypothetical protein
MPSGDEVLAFNEWKPKSTSTTDTRLSYEKVVDIYTSYKQQTLVHLTLDNGQRLTATEGHPFKTTDGWRDAVLLKKGGQLLLKGGEDGAEAVATDLQPNKPLAQGNNAQAATESVANSATNNSQAANAAQPGERAITIADIRLEVTTVAVYNLEVANAHTFFVGADGVLVHNGNPLRGLPGTYEFPDLLNKGKFYVGSAADLADRTGKWFRSGRSCGIPGVNPMPGSSPRDRLIAEQKRINELGGITKDGSGPLSNKYNPIDPKFWAGLGIPVP